VELASEPTEGVAAETFIESVTSEGLGSAAFMADLCGASRRLSPFPPGRFLALVFPQVHIAIGIIDHAALPGLRGPPEREHQAEEDEPHNLK
jgi:hypothetical protein